MSKVSEDRGSWWKTFCKNFSSLEEPTLGYIKLVLYANYKKTWEELSAECKDTVKRMIGDYWYTHSKELVESVKEWCDFGSLVPTSSGLSELLEKQYCVEMLCLDKETRDSLFHMTTVGRVYKEMVLKKFSDWLSNAFLSASVPTFEYSLDHIAAVEGVDVASISNEIKEEVKKMLDERTKKIEKRGKVTQKRDSKGRFISNKEHTDSGRFKVEYSYEDVAEVTIKIIAPLSYRDKTIDVKVDIPYES